MKPEVLERFQAEVKAGRVSPAEYLIATTLDHVVDELKQLNGLLVRLMEGPKPVEPIAKTIQKGQAKR